LFLWAFGENLIRWPGAAFERKPVAINSEKDTKFISFGYGQNLPSQGYRIVLLGNVEYIDEIAATASLAAGMTPFPLEALGRRELR
jgi:hypothetical protein